jgi:hypothetical protein
MDPEDRGSRFFHYIDTGTSQRTRRPQFLVSYNQIADKLEECIDM